MDVKNLVPWARSKNAPANRTDEEGSPFLTLHREINRLFDDFAHGFDWPMERLGWSNTMPKLDMSDDGKQISVVAELPGMEEKDVELTLEDGLLTIRGEKKTENEGPQYSERWQGRFERQVSLGRDIDPEKVSATFKNGLLTVTAAKKPEEQRTAKRIPISA